jgi:hypothetical protein
MPTSIAVLGPAEMEKSDTDAVQRLAGVPLA